MHTDQLFENFGGVSPAAHDAKEELHSRVIAPAPTPAPTHTAYQPAASPQTPASVTTTGGPTLEAFLAAFANDHASSSTGYRLPLTLPLPYSSAPTPAGVDTASIIPRTANSEEENGERLSGAKKLKSVGAPPAEIEEDKRRRNTEASARFRQKKKERENALETRASTFTSYPAFLYLPAELVCVSKPMLTFKQKNLRLKCHNCLQINQVSRMRINFSRR